MRGIKGDPLWTVIGWATEPQRDSGSGCSFTLWASPRFIAAAREMVSASPIDESMFQRRVKAIIGTAYDQAPEEVGGQSVLWHDGMMALRERSERHPS